MFRQLIREAVHTTIGLTSVRIECTSSIEAEHPQQRSGARRWTLTIVGDDHHESGDINGGEVAQHVRAILGVPRESLNYRGVEWVRDPRHGEWLKLLPREEDEWEVHSEAITLHATGDESVDPLSEEERKRLYFILGADPSDVLEYNEVAREPIDHSTVLHVSGQSSQAVPRANMPSVEEFEKSVITPPETLENYRRLLDTLPNRYERSIDLWIDEETRLIHRINQEHRGFRDDRIVHYMREDRVFVLFNEAELPGPLPD